MPRTSSLMSVCFCAGMLGALCSSLLAWQSGQLGIPAVAGVNMSYQMSSGWIYSRMIWGGIWGLIYFLTVGPPRFRRHWARKGLWVSLLPTAFQLFYVFPQMSGHGLLGLDLGQLTPLFVLSYNLFWGLCTGVFCRMLWGRG